MSLWHLLFAIHVNGAWYVAFDYDGKYNLVDGPLPALPDAFASMREHRGQTSTYGGEYR